MQSISPSGPGDEGEIDCRLTRLSRTPPPPLPGGYALGEKVYYTGDSQTCPDGDKLTPGQAGEVTRGGGAFAEQQPPLRQDEMNNDLF